VGPGLAQRRGEWNRTMSWGASEDVATGLVRPAMWATTSDDGEQPCQDLKLRSRQPQPTSRPNRFVLSDRSRGLPASPPKSF